MPELPEIAHLQRTLELRLRGATVRHVRLLRGDVVHADGARPRRRDLLLGGTIHHLHRHGKELALVSGGGPTLCIHLGMSGQLFFCPVRHPLPRFDHVHCMWSIDAPQGAGRLVFRDPRRFGGIWCYASQRHLRATRWSLRGPDALQVRASVLAQRLGRTRRVIKAALLDQRVIAGVGNIYADEILFAARLSPLAVCRAVPPNRLTILARATRTVLARAIAAGGSTIRDYRDGDGQPGGFAGRHQVYGRRSQPCVCCGRPLAFVRIGQRATVFCHHCQESF